MASDQSVLAPCAGRPLGSHMECFWRVRVWDQNGRASAWSQPARWTMGILRPEEWKAQWLGDEIPEVTNHLAGTSWIWFPAGEPARAAAPATDYFRRVASLPAGRQIRRAIFKYTGDNECRGWLDIFDLGARNNFRTVKWNDLTTRLELYVAFDVTRHARLGANAIGAALGGGRYYADRSRVYAGTVSWGSPKLLLHLRIEHTDGSVSEVVSDGSLEFTTDGPILANSEFDGEEYDARREIDGWAAAGHRDARWRPAPLAAAPAAPLVAQMAEPIRVTQTLKPKSVTKIAPGKFIFDLGQNMAGWRRLRVRGPAGAEIRLRHAETLNEDGSLFPANLRGARATDLYVLRGAGTEVWEPRCLLARPGWEEYRRLHPGFRG